MTFSKINPRISSYAYLHKIGDKDTELSVTFFKTDDGKQTASDQLLSELYNNHIKPTDTFNAWLTSFIKDNNAAIDYPKEMILDMIKMIGVDEDDLILDMYTQLDMSKSEDVARYLKLINRQNHQPTLFEMLDSDRLLYHEAPIMFKNPSDTKRFKFAKGTYPMSMSNQGGTYSINLYATSKDNSNFKRVASFSSNDAVYDYIEQNNLTF